jgi:hypothetical protein
MKSHDATLIAGTIFVIMGIVMWNQYDSTTKWFALGVNLMGIGLAIGFTSLLQKFG